VVAIPARAAPTPGRLVRWIPRLPPEPRSTPVVYSAPLIAYVGLVAAGAVAAAALTVRPPFDAGLLILGGCATFALGATIVRALSGVGSHWSASVFAHLGLTLAAGPPGAAVAALAEEAGNVLRMGHGWFRATFNVANAFLDNLAAWAAFHAVVGSATPLGLGRGLAAGAAAGAVQYTANIGLLAGVQRISDSSLDVARYIGENAANVLPYHLGAGCTAFGGVLLVGLVGPAGFILLLIPVGLLQAFVLVLAARTRAAQVQREAHQRERERLLQQALAASDAERRRIARDVHDGVVQDLAAVVLGLRAEAERSPGPPSEVMRTAAAAAADAMQELRTLLREIAPPDLQDRGLTRALDELSETLREHGVTVTIDVAPEAETVRGRALEAAYRIAQEALRNVDRHAQARHVRVEAARRDGALDLIISDDGVGFSADERRRRTEEGHLGLSLIGGLAREAGGELSVVSAPERGTQVRTLVPVDPGTPSET
jgi:signal transduction histidine kinase